MNGDATLRIRDRDAELRNAAACRALAGRPDPRLVAPETRRQSEEVELLWPGTRIPVSYARTTACTRSRPWDSAMCTRLPRTSRHWSTEIGEQIDQSLAVATASVIASEDAEFRYISLFCFHIFGVPVQARPGRWPQRRSDGERDGTSHQTDRGRPGNSLRASQIWLSEASRVPAGARHRWLIRCRFWTPSQLVGGLRPL